MQLEYYFDFSCPYAYLGARAVEQLAKETGAELSWCPMLLGGLFRSLGDGSSPMESFSESKSQHNLRDMERFATLTQTPLSMPTSHPMRTVLALRALLASPSSRWTSVIMSIYQAYWVEGEDITQKSTIEDALKRGGLCSDETQTAMKGTETEEIKTALRERTDQALSIGVFGAPTTAVVKNDSRTLFWGQDKIEMIRATLAGWTPPDAPPISPTWRGSETKDLRIDFWFDFSSPFAYLAATQIEAFASAHNAKLRYRPMLLGALFNNIGTPVVPLFAFSETKQNYFKNEPTRWSSYWRVPFKFSQHFPIKTVTALRMILAADSPKDLTHAIFRATWAENRDVSDPDVLRAIADAAGYDGAALLEATQSPDVKQALFTNTSEAQELGVFGAPTLTVNHGSKAKVFWGQDRLSLLDQLLAKNLLAQVD